MIGTDLNLDLPTLGDSFADIVAKLVVALAAVEDSLAEKATPAGLDITTELSIGGNHLTDVTSLVMAAGNASESDGAFYYDGEEFWLITPAGTIQLTDNGGVAGSPGSITNLVSPAAVTYDSASQEFRFTADTGVYADLRTDDVILVGALGTVRLSCHDTLGGARQINIKSLPFTGVSLLMYDSATSTLEDGRKVTNHTEFSTIKVDSAEAVGAVVADSFNAKTDYRHDGVLSKAIPITGGSLANSSTPVGAGTSTFSVETASRIISSTWNAGDWWQRDLDLRKGDRVKVVRAYVTDVNAGTAITFRLCKRDTTGARTVIHSTSTSAPGTGNSTLTITVSPPAAILADESYFVEVDFASVSNALYGVSVDWDHP